MTLHRTLYPRRALAAFAQHKIRGGSPVQYGDMCESNFQKVTLPTGTFAMQPIRSNQDGGCVITPGGTPSLG